MKFKPVRTDRLSPQEREIVDRFERGVIDAVEAGRLLIESATSARSEPVEPEPEKPLEPVGESMHGAEERGPTALDGASEEERARALVERIAQDVYDDRA